MCKVLFLTLLLVGVLYHVKCQTDNPIEISLYNFNPADDNNVYDNFFDLRPNSSKLFKLVNVPEGKAFVIIQAHSHLIPITLSELPNPLPKQYVNGTNVGLYYALPSSTPFFYLSNPSTSYLTTLVAVSWFPVEAPVPGGNNMEFLTPIAPYLQLTLTNNVIKVDAQPASLDTGDKVIEYEMYHLYLSEWDYTEHGYFESLKKLIGLSNVREFGRKVSPALYGPGLRRVYSSYYGIGEVFTVVATYGNHSSVYVPIATYSCRVNITEEICEEIISSELQLLLGVVFFAGIFLCVKGHVFFKRGLFCHALFFGFVVSYVVIDIYGQTSFEENIFSAVVVGIAFGLLWVTIWVYFGIPILSVSVPNLNLGFLFESVIFYSGAADVRIMQNHFNFWMVFITILFATSIFLPTAAERQGNILTSSLFGSFCTILTLSHFIGAYFHYTVINIIRRAIDPDFQTAVIDPPFQTLDCVLVFIWFALFICGYQIQHASHRGRPPFPGPSFVPHVGTSSRRFEREPLISAKTRAGANTCYSSTG